MNAVATIVLSASVEDVAVYRTYTDVVVVVHPDGQINGDALLHGGGGTYTVRCTRLATGWKAECTGKGVGVWIAKAVALRAAEAAWMAVAIPPAPSDPTPPPPGVSGVQRALAMMDRRAEDPDRERERARIVAEARRRSER